MYDVVVEYLQQQHREHSEAQHSEAQHSTGTAQSPLNKAAKQVRADQSTYQVSKEAEKRYACVRTRMRRVRVVFLEHGALGTCKSPVRTKNVGPSTSTSYIGHFVSFSW